MKFTTEKNEIVEALQMGASIAERRQTIPILANLRIVARAVSYTHLRAHET